MAKTSGEARGARGWMVLLWVVAVAFVLLGIAMLANGGDLFARLLGAAMLPLAAFAVVNGSRRSKVLRRGDRCRLNGTWYPVAAVQQLELGPSTHGPIMVAHVLREDGRPKVIRLEGLPLGRRGEESPLYAETRRLLGIAPQSTSAGA